MSSQRTNYGSSILTGKPLTQPFSDSTTTATETITTTAETTKYGHDPEEISELQKVVEKKLQVLEEDPLGFFRGVRLLQDKMGFPNNKEGKRRAKEELNRLLYQRHALRHGAKDLTEIGPQAMGKTFLGEKTKIEISFKYGKEILRQKWRFRRSRRLDRIVAKAIKVAEEKQVAAAAAAAAADKEQKDSRAETPSDDSNTNIEQFK